MSSVDFYVYRIFDGHQTVYVGKGSGRRLDCQIKKFGMPGEVVETCTSDDHAFERERHWISVFKPTENRLPGGNGGRVRPKPISSAMKRAAKEYRAMVSEIERVGSKRFVAQFLVSRLSSENIGSFGVSEVELSRLRGVANGLRL